MARIRQEDVEGVRERTDLVRLVQQYVGLKKAGRAFSGLCPFHTEKTPSFTVDPGKQVYYCFGCGKGGNAFHFLQEVEGLTFPEAVERLAGQAGVTLRYEGTSLGERRAASRRRSLHRANERAGELYHRMLLEGREAENARRYLASRGIVEEAVERFGIGYAPGYPDFLLRRLARDLSPEMLIEAGVAMKDGRGRVRDRFRARVMFPVHDLTDNAVGFGARILEGEGPKYLNSPETPVYRKGEMLYNLNRAKGQVTRSGEAYVVEGYTDVIALHQAGIETAVATCGTALSEGHFRLLSRFARRAVLAFDSDEAGSRAAERAFAFHERYPLEADVLVLPEGLDPADLVTERGPEGFVEAAAGAVPLVEYMVRRALEGHDLGGPEGRARAVQAALPIVAGLQDPVRRDQYGGLLAELAGVSPTSVQLELERHGPGEARPAEDARPREVRSPVREVEKEVLKLTAQYPELVATTAGRTGEEHFETERYRRAWALLREPGADAASLVERTEEKSLGQLVVEVTVEPLKGEATEAYAERVFSRLHELFLDRRIATMRRRLERLNPTTEPDTFDALFREMADLSAERRRVRARAGEEA